MISLNLHFDMPFLIVYFLLITRGKSTPEMMKAALIDTFGRPNVIKLKSVPVPQINPNQILVKVKAAGVNPVDQYVRMGTCTTLPTLPAILGKEIAGIVEQVGSNCTNHLNKGDRVFCGVDSGGYAEYAAANDTDCFPLDKKLTYSQGACLFVAYFTCFRGLVYRGHTQKGDIVLLQGAAGILGHAAVEVAKSLGTTVVASVDSIESELLMRRAGADYIAYHTREGDLDRILKSVKSDGFHTILEMSPALNLTRDKQYVFELGRIVVVGNRVCITEAGRPVYTISFFKYTEEEKITAAGFILSGIDEGSISPIIEKEYPLSKVMNVHHQLSYRNYSKGKMVIIVNDE